MTSTKSKVKAIGLRTLGSARMFDLSLRLNQRRLGESYLVVAAIHDTPPSEEAALRRRLTFLAEFFDFVRPEEALCDVKPKREHKRPRIVFTFDDALRSNYRIAAPLIESFDTRAMFLIPNDFVSGTTAGTMRAEYGRARSHNILARDGSLQADDFRVSMTWNEVRDLKQRGHLIGSHTKTHRRLGPATLDKTFDLEVCQAKAELENRIDCEVSVFCWVGGEDESYSVGGMKAIRDAGFRYALTSTVAPVSPLTNPLEIPRVQFETNASFESFLFAFSAIRQRRYRGRTKLISELNAASV